MRSQTLRRAAATKAYRSILMASPASTVTTKVASAAHPQASPPMPYPRAVTRAPMSPAIAILPSRDR